MLSLTLHPARYAEAARTLARAYRDDPGLCWLLPERSRRESQLCWLFERRVRGVAGVRASAITAGSEGVALWLPPLSAEQTRHWAALQLRLALAPLVLGPSATRRLVRLERGLRRRHRRVLREPHWMLLALGVEPRNQGDGVGRDLLRSGLERADAAGQPAFLVTHNPRTLELFAMHGFEIVADGPVCRGGPMTWSMRREVHPIGCVSRGV